MGRASYILVGTEQAMKETFGSTCHGAGRLQSRAAAKKHIRGRDVLAALEARGITVRTGSLSGLAEEPAAAMAAWRLDAAARIAADGALDRLSRHAVQLLAGN